MAPGRRLAELGQRQAVAYEETVASEISWPRHRRGQFAGSANRVLAPHGDVLPPEIRAPEQTVFSGDDNAEHLVLTGDEPGPRQPHPQPAAPTPCDGRSRVRILWEVVPLEGRHD